MASIGTKTGVSIAILCGVLALLLVGGGALVMLGYAGENSDVEDGEPIAMKNEDNSIDSEGFDGNRSADNETANNRESKNPEETNGNTGIEPATGRDTTPLTEIRTLKFSGRVVDQHGKGIAGAWVGVAAKPQTNALADNFRNLASGSLRSSRTPSSSEASSSSNSLNGFPFDKLTFGQLTDAKGNFNLAGRGKRTTLTTAITLSAWAKGFSEGQSRLLVPVGGTDDFEMKIALQTRERYLLFRTDPPCLVDIELELSGFTNKGLSRWQHLQRYSSSVSPDGLHQLTLDDKRLNTLKFRVDGFALSEIDIKDASLNIVDLGTVQLQKGRRIAGVIVDESGVPVPGAIVRLSEMHEFDWHKEAGADGRFEFLGVDAKARTIYSRHKNFAETTHTLVSTEQDVDSLTLTMHEGFKVQGIVRFNGTTIPSDLNSVEVRLERAEDYDRFGRFGFPVKNGVKIDETHAYKFERIGAGNYILEASIGDSWSPVVRVRVDDQPVQADVVFGTGASVKGRVLGQDGQPLANEMVLMGKLSKDGSEFDGGLLKQTKTDAQGDYLFESVEPGTYVVYIPKADANLRQAMLNRQRVNVNSGIETFDIDFSKEVPGNRVIGWVTLDGQAIFDVFMLLGTGLNTGAWRVQADADGRFEIQGIPPGQYYLIGTSQKNGSTVFSTSIEFGGWDETNEVTESLGGGTLNVTLLGEGLDPDSVRLSLTPVYDKRFGDHMLEMAAFKEISPKDGKFEFTNLVCGKYVVVATARGFGLHSAVVEVTSKASVEIEMSALSGTIEVEIAKVTGGSIDVRNGFCILRCVALDQPGKPTLFFSPSALKTGASIRTPSLVPGKYEIHVTGPGIEPHVESFTVIAGKKTMVPLTLRRGADVKLLLAVKHDLPKRVAIVVTDRTSGKRVRIEGPVNGMLMGGSVPAPSGYIDVGPLKAGSYRIKVLIRGYKTVELDITLEGSESLSRTLKLEEK